MSESNYCWTLDLSLNSLEIWDLFNPLDKKGELCIKVLLDDSTYEFMCEERTAPIETNGTVFSVWGRSKQALLDKPYSSVITDTEETNHIWQEQTCSVTQIINYIKSNFCPTGTDIRWEVDDFVVEKTTYSVSNKTPIEIISELADIIGAQLVANLDGSLSIKTYEVSSDSVIASYNDLDHLILLDENVHQGFGYNAITVVGHSGSGNSAQIQHEVLESEEKEKWELNKSRTVRVYYYHPKGKPLSYYPLDGIYAQSCGGGTVSKTEKIVLTWGSGNTSYFDVNGNNEISGDKELPLEIKYVTYSVKYEDFSVSVSDTNEHYILFYFSDKSANDLFSVQIDDGGSTEDKQCSSLDIEAKITTYPKFEICIYGSIDHVKYGIDIMGAPIDVPRTSRSETIKEFIVFVEGKASLSKPIFGNFKKFIPCGTNPGYPSFAQYTKELTVDYENPVGVYVEYITPCYYEEFSIPMTFQANSEQFPNYTVYYFTTCGSLSTSVSSDNSSQKNQSDSSSNVSFENTKLLSSNDSQEVYSTEMVKYGDTSKIDSIKDENGSSYSVNFSPKQETVEDKLVFVSGEASLSKPYSSGLSVEFLDGHSDTVKVSENETGVSISDKENGHVAKVTYYAAKYANEMTVTANKNEDGSVDSIDFLVKDKDGNSTSATFDPVSDASESEEDYALEIDPRWKETNGIETRLHSSVSDTERIFHFLFYGDPDQIKRSFSSEGFPVTINTTVGYASKIEEQLNFVDKQASLSGEYFSGMQLTPTGANPDLYFTEGSGQSSTGNTVIFSVKKYSKKVTIDCDQKYVFAKAEYNTYGYEGSVNVNTTFSGELTTYVETNSEKLYSIATKFDDLFGSEHRRITLNVKDYTSDVSVSKANVYIDGTFYGTTDADGSLTIPFISTGDHKIKILADGYLSSDKDELANDTFTVG
jgi:hypothetical protein